MTYQFDSSSVIYQSPVGILSANVVSYAAWTWHDTFSLSQSWTVFSTDSINGASLTHFFVRSSANHIRLGQRYTSANGEWRTADGTVPPGEWVHVAATYVGTSSSNELTFYINGDVSATIHVEGG